MSPMMKTLLKLARSRQGRTLTSQAMAYARSPQGQTALAQVNARKRRR